MRKPSEAMPATPNTLSNLLEPFTKAAVPQTSRAGHTIAQAEAKKRRLIDAWQYVPFLASQATNLTSAFVSHHLFGPPKKSWGIEMTLFTTMLRGSATGSHLSNVSTVRKLMNLGSLLPVPTDGVVTPVTWKVKSYGLKGMLEKADKAEDGTRELTGEWVTTKRKWRKMQHEYARRGRKDSQSHVSKEKTILYLHGGAYYVMSAATHRVLTISLAKYTEARLFAINYRLAPETRFPGPLHDAVVSYYRLVYELKIPPENIVLAGDSAGGGLCMATLHYLRDSGYPLPGGAILMSPWVDLTMSCDSWETNAPYDYLPMPQPGDHLNPIGCYLGSDIETHITHPYASPLFGDMEGLPPLLIQCGDAEVLRDEGTLLAHKASMAGVEVHHEIYEDCPHVFPFFLFLEASRKALQSSRRFMKRLGAGRSADTSKIDREVMADAHNVKSDGRPEKSSLPLTPASDQPSEESSDEIENEAEKEDGQFFPGGMVGNAMNKMLGETVKAATQVDEPPRLDLYSPADSDASMDFNSRTEDTRSPTSSTTSSRPKLGVKTTLSSNYVNNSNLFRSKTPNTALPTALPTALATPGKITNGKHQRSHTHFDMSPLSSPGLSRSSAPRARSCSHPNLKNMLDEYEKSGHNHIVQWQSSNQQEDLANDYGF